MSDLKRPPLPRTVWLVKHGPGYGAHFHESLVPGSVHPVVVCSQRHTAYWEAGATGRGATVWVHDASTGGGWLIERWNGFDLDYGHVVHGFDLPDGTRSGFVHRHTEREPWSLLDGAVWWSPHRMPDWLREDGVVYPQDSHSRKKIEDLPGLCTLSFAKSDKERERWAQYQLPWEAE